MNKLDKNRVIGILDRLAKVTPMPDDENITQDVMTEYYDIVCTIDDHERDMVFLQPIFDSFGYGDGSNIYLPGVRYLMTLPREQVMAEAVRRLKNGSDGAKKWTLYMLREMHMDNRLLIPNEHELIQGCMEGPDLVRLECVYLLSCLQDARAKRMLQVLSNDVCDNVSELAKDMLSSKDKEWKERET